MPTGDKVFWGGGYFAGKLHIISGKKANQLSDGSAPAEVYVRGEGWESAPLPLPNLRTEAGCAAYNDTTVFIAGGYNQGYLSSVSIC